MIFFNSSFSCMIFYSSSCHWFLLSPAWVDSLYCGGLCVSVKNCTWFRSTVAQCCYSNVPPWHFTIVELYRYQFVINVSQWHCTIMCVGLCLCGSIQVVLCPSGTVPSAFVLGTVLLVFSGTVPLCHDPQHCRVSVPSYCVLVVLYYYGTVPYMCHCFRSTVPLKHRASTRMQHCASISQCRCTTVGANI